MSARTTVAITGANGFLGSELVREMRERDTHTVRPVFRREGFGEGAVVGNIDGSTDWSAALSGVGVVIHLAGIGVDPVDAAEFEMLQETNVRGALRLAEAAAKQGVRRFVYLSTVKVLGERTEPGHPFTNSTDPNPASPYPQSKRDAELGLLRMAEGSSMEVLFVRPPMVYGPRPFGNFARLVRLVERGLPIPLGRVQNLRSMISRANLVDALIHSVDCAGPVNRGYLVSDGIDLSTADLVRTMAEGLGRPARLLPVPLTLLRAGAGLLGRGGEARRLLDSLQLDIRETTESIGWAPPKDGWSEIRSAAKAMRS